MGTFLLDSWTLEALRLPQRPSQGLSVGGGGPRDEKRRSQILGHPVQCSGLSLSRRRGPFFSESLRSSSRRLWNCPGVAPGLLCSPPAPVAPAQTQPSLCGKARLAGSEEVVLSSPDFRPDFRFQSVLCWFKKGQYRQCAHQDSFQVRLTEVQVSAAEGAPCGCRLQSGCLHRAPCQVLPRCETE